jgi:hypothetical protein
MAEGSWAMLVADAEVEVEVEEEEVACTALGEPLT